MKKLSQEMKKIGISMMAKVTAEIARRAKRPRVRDESEHSKDEREKHRVASAAAAEQVDEDKRDDGGRGDADFAVARRF